MRRLRKHNILLVSSGLVGVAVVSILTFITLPQLTYRLRFAIFCFSVAIPALTASIVLVRDEKNEPIEAKASHALVFFTGTLIGFAGIAAIFFHLSIWAGIVFLICSVVSAAAVSTTKVPR